MTKENAKDFLPLVQALAEGKTIQIIAHDNKNWIDSSSWNFTKEPKDYRIKPEPPKPKDIWVNEYNKELLYSQFFGHETQEKALYEAGEKVARKAVHYREVIE